MSNRLHRAVASTTFDSFEPRLHLTTAATISGSSSADVIHMTVDDSSIYVDVNGYTNTLPRFLYNSVSIDGGGGADRIYIDGNENAPTTVNAGNGDDEIHLGAANETLDYVASGVTLISSSGNDKLFLHDSTDPYGDTYTVNSGKVSRVDFPGVTYSSPIAIKLTTGPLADTFNVVNTNGANLIIDAGAGADHLNLNENGGGAATVSFDSDQDFADVQSMPGGNLNLTGNAGLLLTTNLSNFNGNVTLGMGYIVERKSQVTGGLGYWRGRLANGTTSTTPSLTSTYATSSAVNDAIGYAYAQDLPFTSVNGNTLSSGDLVLRYTLKGDANLDRSVNFADLVLLAQNYNQSSTSVEWKQGDFDLSHSVNFADLVALAQNYNATAPTVLAVKKPATKVAASVLA